MRVPPGLFMGSLVEAFLLDFVLFAISKNLAQVRHGFLENGHVFPAEELVEPRRQAHEVRVSWPPHPDTYLRRQLLICDLLPKAVEFFFEGLPNVTQGVANPPFFVATGRQRKVGLSGLCCLGAR